MKKQIDVDELLAELERRKQEIFHNQDSKVLQSQQTLKIGAVLGINDAMVVIKKIAKD